MEDEQVKENKKSQKHDDFIIDEEFEYYMNMKPICVIC